MPPVFALVIQPLVEHLHDLNEITPGEDDPVSDLAYSDECQTEHSTGCMSFVRFRSFGSQKVPMGRLK